jgi:ATP-binding cassette subfamily B protein
MLLDEPTSAMDSWSETDWYARLRSHAESRAVVLATHRLTIAMRADLIHVIRGGRIAESGTHEELLAVNGHYANAWRAQVESSVPLDELQTTSA